MILYQLNGIGDFTRLILTLKNDYKINIRNQFYIVSTNVYNFYKNYDIINKENFIVIDNNKYTKYYYLFKVLFSKKIPSNTVITTRVGHGCFSLILLNIFCIILNLKLIIIEPKKASKNFFINNIFSFLKTNSIRTVYIHYGCDDNSRWKLPNLDYIQHLTNELKERNIKPILLYGKYDQRLNLNVNVEEYIATKLDDISDLKKQKNIVLINFDSGIGHFASMCGIQTLIIGGIADISLSAPVDSMIAPSILPCSPCQHSKNYNYKICINKPCFYSTLI